jgi:hypothetical protein
LADRFIAADSRQDCARSAAAALGEQTHQLAGVAAIEVELAVEDPCGGFEMRGAVFGERVAGGAQRLANGGGYILAMQKEWGD